MIRHRITLLLSALLLSTQLFAQNEKLDIKGVYERAIKEYVKLHPEDVVAGKHGHFLFIKEAPYTQKLATTLDSIQLVFVNPDSAEQQLKSVLPEKKKFILLHIHQLFARASVNYVYFYPMKTSWNPKKRKLQEPKYDDRICRFDFDFSVEHGDVSYTFKEATCNLNQ